MMRANDFADWYVGNRCIDVRNEMQPPWTDPRAFDGNIGQILGNELTNARRTVNGGDELQIDLRLAQHGGRHGTIAGHAFVLIAHGDDKSAFRIATKTRGIRHQNPFVIDQRPLERFQRLGNCSRMINYGQDGA
jgi:hypothetical protein